MKARYIILAMGLALSGCGFKELPSMKQQVQESFREMQVQYRLRADLVPHFIKVVEGHREFSGLVQELKASHLNAISMDMPIEKYDKKQMNRLVSFQSQLSGNLGRFITQITNDSRLSKNGEYLSLKEQLERYETRIHTAREIYDGKSVAFNQRLDEVPSKWINNFYYKFTPAPALEN